MTASTPACRYCGRRCFVLRTMPADALHYAGKDLLLATCAPGMAHDRVTTGHDQATAVDAQAPWPPGSPVGAPAAVPGDLPHIDEPPAATPAPVRPRQPVSATGPAQPCEGCGLPVAAAYVTKTGRALHGPCAGRATGSAA